MKMMVWSILLLVLIMPADVMCSENNLKAELRVRPLETQFTLICRATNITAEGITVDRILLHGANQFEVSKLHDPDREWSTFGAPGGMPPDDEAIPPGKTRQWELDKSGLEDLEYRSTYDNVSGGPGAGRYNRIRWFINSIRTPQEVLIAVTGKDGALRTPVPRTGDKTSEFHIGFLYDMKNPLKLVFLVIDGKNEVISIARPFTRNSRIIASSPAIGYTRELFIAASASERIVVEAGKVGEWRLPWQTVLDLIPKDDLERIKAAGGDLDLVWKVGEYQSDPLPLSLADPENITRSSEK